MDDNTRQVAREENTVVAGEPQETTVSQSSTTTGATAPVAPAAGQSTVQTTTTSAEPRERLVSHSVAERVVDPAAEKAASVGWLNSLIWFIIGLIAALIAIRFVLLLTGANPDAGFAELIYGITGVLVAPFQSLFGGITYPGAETTAVFEPGSLIAIVVYILIGWLLTRLAALALGTNRTRGTVYTETDRDTRL